MTVFIYSFLISSCALTHTCLQIYVYWTSKISSNIFSLVGTVFVCVNVCVVCVIACVEQIYYVEVLSKFSFGVVIIDLVV